MRREDGAKHRTLRHRLRMLTIVGIVPILLIAVYLLYSLVSYSNAYDRIVTNLTVANNYNLNFREEMDEGIYRCVARGETFNSLSDQEGLEDPYVLLDDLRSNFETLESIATDRNSRTWLQTLLRNIDILEDRVDDIAANLEEGGHYNDNVDMLDNNIYMLTELIQDDIQQYIYYQTKNIETLKNNLNSQVVRLSMIIVALLISVFLIQMFLSSRLLRSIMKTLNDLNGVTSQIAQGNFSARASTDTDEEIARLAESVNGMAVSLENQVQKIHEDEALMRRAELRLLQEQINPHFLYNTLDTIFWLIESGKEEDAQQMVLSLSKFFRLVLSRGKEYIAIADEEQHIRSYLEIQSARYKDILEYEIRIDPDIYPYTILKLTLQPIVENALYHGIKYKRDKGKILVTGQKSGDDILLKVIDDGVGMAPEDLKKLLADIEKPCQNTDAGFGMANVNERLHMNYGRQYGLSVESEQGKGTCVTIRIPAIKQESGDLQDYPHPGD